MHCFNLFAQAKANPSARMLVLSGPFRASQAARHPSKGHSLVCTVRFGHLHVCGLWLRVAMAHVGRRDVLPSGVYGVYSQAQSERQRQRLVQGSGVCGCAHSAQLSVGGREIQALGRRRWTTAAASHLEAVDARRPWLRFSTPPRPRTCPRSPGRVCSRVPSARHRPASPHALRRLIQVAAPPTRTPPTVDSPAQACSPRRGPRTHARLARALAHPSPDGACPAGPLLPSPAGVAALLAQLRNSECSARS